MCGALSIDGTAADGWRVYSREVLVVLVCTRSMAEPRGGAVTHGWWATLLKVLLTRRCRTRLESIELRKRGTRYQAQSINVRDDSAKRPKIIFIHMVYKLSYT